MKHIFLGIFLLFFLIGCGDSSEETQETPAGLTQYTATGFSLGVPSAWENMTFSGQSLPTPNVGNLELALVSNSVRRGFKNNLTVLSYPLKKFQTSTQFAISNNTVSKEKYESYTPISNKYITFGDNHTSMLYVFKAQYNSNTPELTFIQTARVCGSNTVYIPTIAIPAVIMDTKKYEKILETFTCSTPQVIEE